LCRRAAPAAQKLAIIVSNAGGGRRTPCAAITSQSYFVF
jgi:hypothetical protein